MLPTKSPDFLRNPARPSPWSAQVSRLLRRFSPFSPATAIFPSAGPTTDSFISLHPNSNFLAVGLVLFVSLNLNPQAHSAEMRETVDYTGWQILLTGVEITTTTYHFRLRQETFDDTCTLIKHGNSRYVVEKTPSGKGIDQFGTKMVSASNEITVSGQGKAYFPDARLSKTKRWSYKLGPADYPHDIESFCMDCGGVPRSSPDEPMFLPRRMTVHSYVPESEWGVTATESSLASAKAPIVRAWSRADSDKSKPLDFVFPHRLDGQHLQASGHRSFTDTDGFKTETSDSKTTTTIEVTYNAVVIPTPNSIKPPRVELVETDRNWLPEEKNSLTARMTVHDGKPAEAFRFILYAVSQEPGLCANSPDSNTDPDLSFAKASGWNVEQQGDQWIATSGHRGNQATIEIQCHDWGAWGKLKGEAKIDGTWEPAMVVGGLDSVNIPYDDDDDHIADSWQADKDVACKAAKADSEKRPTDQANDGDGLSVYEDYRGFYVLGPDGTQQHVRLDPRRKALFVSDNSRYFLPDEWEKDSGIEAHMLNSDMSRAGSTPTASRVVNFHSVYGRNGDKACVVISLVPELHKDREGDMPLGLCNDDGAGPQSPRHVTGLFLYPGNAMSLIGAATTGLGIATAQPNSSEALEWDKLGLPRWMWKKAMDRLMNETYRQKLVDECMRQTAIHEVGHACGLWGHFSSGDPKRQETFGLGDKTCPMYYAESKENMQYLILQVLLNPDAPLRASFGKFCKGGDLDCWGHLNVKDN